MFKELKNPWKLGWVVWVFLYVGCQTYYWICTTTVDPILQIPLPLKYLGLSWFATLQIDISYDCIESDRSKILSKENLQRALIFPILILSIWITLP